MSDRDVYIAGCSRQGGVYHFKLSSCGQLSFCKALALDRPMYLAREGNSLYALLREPFGEGRGSGLCAIALGADGSLREVSQPMGTGGQVSAHLCVWSGQVYTANYISGDLSLLPGRIVKSALPGGGAGSHSAAHPHYIDRCPDGEYLAVTDLGLDAVFVYDKALNYVSCCGLPSGSGPRHLAFSPEGRLAYCVNELASSVTVLRYSKGQFAVLGTYEALPAGYSGTSKAAAIRCEGNRLIVSHRGYDCLTVFSRAGDRLIKLGDIPCCGRSPRDFAIWGEFIICANESSDNVTVLRRSADGVGELVQSVSVPAPLCVLL